MSLQLVCALFSSLLLPFFVSWLFFLLIYQFTSSVFVICCTCEVSVSELQLWTAFPMCTCMTKHRCAPFSVVKSSGIPFAKHLPVEILTSIFLGTLAMDIPVQTFLTFDCSGLSVASRCIVSMLILLFQSVWKPGEQTIFEVVGRTVLPAQSSDYTFYFSSVFITAETQSP